MTAHERISHPGYTLALPDRPLPIVLIGAGGIVRDAHLPAYAKAGFEVVSITDLQQDRAAALARQYGVRASYGDVADAVAHAPAEAVYDVALPPEAHLAVLEQLPDGAAVLLQKPLGNDLRHAVQIREVCRRKGLVAAVNTQLRFAPFVAAARQLIADGAVGELYDLQVRVQVDTPWELFPYALELDRLEITMQSVHYVDLVCSFLGDPTGVVAFTVGHPESAPSRRCPRPSRTPSAPSASSRRPTSPSRPAAVRRLRAGRGVQLAVEGRTEPQQGAVEEHRRPRDRICPTRRVRGQPLLQRPPTVVGALLQSLI